MQALIKTFKEWLSEQKHTGNYVSIDCSEFPEHLNEESGIRVPDEKKHVTLIYSENSNVKHSKILDMLKEHSKPITARITCADTFDDLPKDGKRDEKKATLVLKLESDELNAIHEKLKKLGCEHSYPEFSPHVSLYYGMDRDEAIQKAKKISQELNREDYHIKLKGFNVNPIIKDWANTL